MEAKLILRINKEKLIDIWFILIHALQDAGFRIDKAEIRREVKNEKRNGKDSRSGPRGGKNRRKGVGKG